MTSETSDTCRSGRTGAILPEALIAALAAIVRIVYLLQVHEHPLFQAVTGDPALYRRQALDILSGNVVPPHAYFHSSPLYPWFLAAVTAVSQNLDAVRGTQIAVGIVTVLLIMRLTRTAFSRPASLVSGVFAALYVPFIFFEAELLEITLVLVFVAGTLVALLSAARHLGAAGADDAPSRSGLARAACAGLLLGLASLGKPNLLLFAPIGGVWLATRGFGRFGSLKGGRRTGWLPAGLLVFLVTGLTILPATIHNARVEGDLIPVSSNGGINLWIGNHEGATGMFGVPPEMRLDLRRASAEVAERAVGRDLSAGEVSDFWAGRAVSFVQEQPGAWARLTAWKFALFWNHYEIPNHYHLGFVKEFAPVLRLPVGTFAVVAPLGLLGLLLTWRRKATPLFVAFALAFMASVLPFFITGRYRLAIVIVLIPAAGAAVEKLHDFLIEHRIALLAASLVLLALLATAVNVDLIEFRTAPMHNTVGAILGGQGDMERASEAFARAVDEDPRDISSRHNLGKALMALRRPDEAKRHFRVATELHPDYHEAWIGLGRALAVQDSLGAAVRSWRRVVTADPPAPRPIVDEARALIETAEEIMAADTNDDGR
ncbi:MAG: tetratricopeptide repeat protein [Candidatus Eisenbacteria bacterium]|nr:tetratricopeptide repeat protein [Candidatus Eisenbacteria bacterium]